MDTSTCIVVLRQGDTIYIGGDSAGTNDKSLRSCLRADPKVFQRKDSGTTWQFGFTSSYRMGQLIRYQLELPKIEDDDSKDMVGFMVKKFIPALQKCLRQGGYEQKDKEVVMGGTFIVTVKENIFEIQDNYQVAVHIENYWAVGCGDALALGALFATESIANPKKRLRVALQAAERFSAGVRAPFLIMHD